MQKLKSLIISITFLFVNISMYSQDKIVEQKEDWSGKYQIKPYTEKKIENSNSQSYIIQKAPNVNPKNIAEKYKIDLFRWYMVKQNDSEKDSVLLRRFLINEEYNEYEQFGWTKLYKTGKMSCLDGGNIFICKTTVGSKIKIEEEEFISKTGIFGIMLHKGLFELYKTE